MTNFTARFENLEFFLQTNIYLEIFFVCSFFLDFVSRTRRFNSYYLTETIFTTFEVVHRNRIIMCLLFLSPHSLLSVETSLDSHREHANEREKQKSIKNYLINF